MKDTYTAPQSTDEEQAESERLLAQLVPEEATDAERAEIAERFSGLVTNVLRWASEKGITVDGVRRLGGGFKNPVLMLTTPEGKSYVAKAFVEKEALEATMRAQQRFDEIEREDERFIPNSEFGPNSVLFSEKAEGQPVRSLLEQSIADGETSEQARQAFFTLGATLGSIHERTEEPITEASDQQDIEAARIDVDKISRHLSELEVGSLIGLSDDELEAVVSRVSDVTDPEYISLVHADAHLDQFFYADGPLVEIVDYDDIREGDPMADLGRVLSSLRDWCAELNAPFDIETDLTREIARGYESTREEDFHTVDGEMDYMRVVAYELRLRLVQLKQFAELREKLAGITAELHISESDAVLTTDESILKAIKAQLSEGDVSKLDRLRRISKELTEITSYLLPPVEVKHAA